jgi:hypothetical protein
MFGKEKTTASSIMQGVTTSAPATSSQSTAPAAEQSSAPAGEQGAQQ